MTRRYDRWLVLPLVLMALTLAAVIDVDTPTRLFWGAGACFAIGMLETALATARRNRTDVEAELLRRTTGFVSHKVRNMATVVLHGLSPASDHLDRDAAKDALNAIVALPEQITLDTVHPDPRGTP